MDAQFVFFLTFTCFGLGFLAGRFLGWLETTIPACSDRIYRWWSAERQYLRGAAPEEPAVEESAVEEPAAMEAVKQVDPDHAAQLAKWAAETAAQQSERLLQRARELAIQKQIQDAVDAQTDVAVTLIAAKPAAVGKPNIPSSLVTMPSSLGRRDNSDFPAYMQKLLAEVRASPQGQALQALEAVKEEHKDVLPPHLQPSKRKIDLNIVGSAVLSAMPPQAAARHIEEANKWRL